MINLLAKLSLIFDPEYRTMKRYYKRTLSELDVRLKYEKEKLKELEQIALTFKNK